jgi:cytochrome c
MTRRQTLPLAVGAALALALANAAPAHAQSGKELYMAKGCLACHGPTGDKPLQPTYPKIRGQNPQYIMLSLKAFKSQERKGGQAKLMWGMAAQLTEPEMEKIAEFLSESP